MSVPPPAQRDPVSIGVLSRNEDALLVCDRPGPGELTVKGMKDSL